MDDFQLSDLRIEQTTVGGGTVFSTQGIQEEYIGGQEKITGFLFCFVFISIFELEGSISHSGRDVQNSECSIEIEAEMLEGS